MAAMKFKVHFKNGECGDIRRFNLDADQAGSLYILKGKLQIVFPSLRNSEYKIFWKDSDGDKIAVVNDEDLQYVIEDPAEVKVLYVIVSDSKDSDDDDVVFVGVTPGQGQPTVYCDACTAVISGFRYKCLQCPDFDLCNKCENLGLHSEHVMIRCLTNTPLPRCSRKFMGHFHRAMRKGWGRGRHHPHHRGERRGEHRSDEEPRTSRCPFGAESGFDFRDLARQGLPYLEALNPANPAFGETLKHIHDAIADFLKPVETQEVAPQEMDVVNEQRENPQPSAPAQEAAANAPPQPPQPPQMNPKVARALEQMKEMGFSDASGLFTDLLVRYDGDVEKVIRAVLENQK